MSLTGVYTGAHGTIAFAVEGSPAQQADFNAITAAYGDTIFNPIGRAVDVEICVQTELQEYYEIGARDPMQLLPGNVHISGKIGRAYLNGSLLFLLLDRGAKGNSVTTIQPRFVLNLSLRDPNHPTDLLRVNIFGVKFENWAMHIPQDTFVMEQLTFKAISIGVVDNNEGTEINVAFPAS
jgi:hypothetical protein